MTRQPRELWQVEVKAGSRWVYVAGYFGSEEAAKIWASSHTLPGAWRVKPQK